MYSDLTILVNSVDNRKYLQIRNDIIKSLCPKMGTSQRIKGPIRDKPEKKNSDAAGQSNSGVESC